jgi:hypothetical protein
MFEIEAKRLHDCLDRLPSGGLSPILDIGSGSGLEREVEKPWVDACLFKPLRDGGHSVVHLDIDDVPGVDLVADIFTDEGLERARSVAPHTVLLCNILEHVERPAELVERAFDLLPAGGHLIISVPRSYPHHRSPIDTMFRPTPEEVAALAPQSSFVFGEIVATSSYWEDVKQRPWILLRQVLRAPFPFLGWSRYLRTMKKLYWLVNPYLVTIVVMQKPA